MLVVCGGWDCWECQAPGTPILGHIRTPGVVYATGSPADFDGLGVTFVVLPSSRALHRFIVGTDRSPGWFRILPRYCGRTGRLRRTGRNPLRSNRFLHLSRAACHLNVSVGSSGQAYRRWSASLSDGAYPRRERRGIAPVPPITLLETALDGRGRSVSGATRLRAPRPRSPRSRPLPGASRRRLWCCGRPRSRRRHGSA